MQLTNPSAVLSKIIGNTAHFLYAFGVKRLLSGLRNTIYNGRDIAINQCAIMVC